MAFNVSKFAAAGMITSVILYSVCALILYFYPSHAMKMVSAVHHLMDSSTSIARLELKAFILGLVQVAVSSYVAGYLFAYLYNRLEAA